jgi:hypothetical protein
MITVHTSTRQDRVGMAFQGAIPFPSQQAGGAPACAAVSRRPQRGCASGETG